MTAVRFVQVADLPVPTCLAVPVRRVIAITGLEPTSFYRGEDPEGVAILNRYGHHSQGQLVWAYEHGLAAEYGIIGRPDPVGTSTHELRSDSVAFPGPVGRVIPAYECGQDWPDEAIPQVMAAYRRIGELPIHPYSSGLEYHHICLTRPYVAWATLGPGARGHRVLQMTEMLVHTGDLPRRHYRYDQAVRGAVTAFQRRHHLQVDGIVGQHTVLQLRACNRACLKHHRREVHRR